MFIKFGEFFFSEDDVKMVKFVGSGVRVVALSGTYDISYVPLAELEVFETCFTIRRRRYDSYADYRRSRPSEPPKEDPETIAKYSKIEVDEPASGDLKDIAMFKFRNGYTMTKEEIDSLDERGDNK